MDLGLSLNRRYLYNEKIGTSFECLPKRSRFFQIGQKAFFGRSALVRGKGSLSVKTNRGQHRCCLWGIQRGEIDYLLGRGRSSITSRQVGIDAAFVQKHQRFCQFSDSFFLHIEDAHARLRASSLTVSMRDTSTHYWSGLCHLFNCNYIPLVEEGQIYLKLTPLAITSF